MFLERLNDLLPLRRRNIVRNKVLRSQLADGDLARPSEGMTRIDDQGELIAVDHDGFDLRIFGTEGEHAKLDRVHEDLVGDAAGKGALHSEFDPGILPAEFVEKRQEIEAGVLIGRKIEPTPMQRAPEMLSQPARVASLCPPIWQRAAYLREAERELTIHSVAAFCLLS